MILLTYSLYLIYRSQAVGAKAYGVKGRFVRRENVPTEDEKVLMKVNNMLHI